MKHSRLCRVHGLIQDCRCNLLLIEARGGFAETMLIPKRSATMSGAETRE